MKRGRGWPVLLLISLSWPVAHAEDFLVSLRPQGDHNDVYSTRSLDSGTSVLRLQPGTSAEIDWEQDHWVTSAAFSGSLGQGVQMSPDPRVQRWQIEAHCHGQRVHLRLRMMTPSPSSETQRERTLITEVNLRPGHWVDILSDEPQRHDNVVYSTQTLRAPSLQVRVDGVDGARVCSGRHQD